MSDSHNEEYDMKRSFSAATFCLGLLAGLVFAGIYGEFRGWAAERLWLQCEANHERQ